MATLKNLTQPDILILGGGTGGVAAALAACQTGRTVVMTEPTDWIGGQFTSQAVPPDENVWIESGTATERYMQFRRQIRRYYADHYPLTPDGRRNPLLNPGTAPVSKLCHDFRVGLAVLESMLMPYRSNGQLRVLHYTTPRSASVEGDRISSVLVQNTHTGREYEICARAYLDATELGDLLPMTGTEYVSGFESRAMTQEPDAREIYEPLNMQAVSWCFAMDHIEGGEYVIDRPATYDFWRDYLPNLSPPWSGKLLSWEAPNPVTLETVRRCLFRDPAVPFWKWDHASQWQFRRIVDRQNFERDFYASDVTLVNWPMIDYLPGPICEVSEEEASRHLEGARQLSLSWLYWLQTEAPHPDGKGCGYPGLRLREDVTGDEPHGLAKSVYVRESRRIRAEFTVLQQHVAKTIRGELGAEIFADSVGIGHYNIDLHPSTGGNNYIDVPACPFQIPLGALIPVRIENLLPACKNLGVTHITNGCYRLHPVEWNVGEVAGLLASWCIQRDLSHRQVRNTQALLEEFQDHVRRQGIRTEWNPYLLGRA